MAFNNRLIFYTSPQVHATIWGSRGQFALAAASLAIQPCTLSSCEAKRWLKVQSRQSRVLYEAHENVTEQFASHVLLFVSEVSFPSVQQPDIQVLLSHNSIFPPALPGAHQEGLFLWISPRLHSSVTFKLTNTSTVRNSSQTQPARQTARRNSSQTRPQTSSLQTSLSLKLKDISNLQQKLLSTASTLLLTKVWRHYRLISALADCISIHWRARLNKYSSQNIIVGCTLGFPNCLSLTWTS